MGIGDSGGHSDGEILLNSDFGQTLENSSISIPEPCPLTGTTQAKLSYMILANGAFSTIPWTKTPMFINFILLKYTLYLMVISSMQRSSHVHLQIEQGTQGN